MWALYIPKPIRSIPVLGHASAFSHHKPAESQEIQRYLNGSAIKAQNPNTTGQLVQELFPAINGYSYPVEAELLPKAPVVDPLAGISLAALLDQYWTWGLLSLQPTCCNTYTEEKVKVEKKGKNKSKKNLMIKLGDFSNRADTLLNVLQSITSSNVVLVTAKKKAESRRGPLSNKRSEYIGVSRNGPHWQALITIKKRKTYIGSYRSERDAALAFDFYSLLLHSLTSKTNFNYTKEDIWDMISNFRENGDRFKPELLHPLKHASNL